MLLNMISYSYQARKLNTLQRYFTKINFELDWKTTATTFLEF